MRKIYPWEKPVPWYCGAENPARCQRTFRPFCPTADMFVASVQHRHADEQSERVVVVSQCRAQRKRRHDEQKVAGKNTRNGAERKQTCRRKSRPIYLLTRPLLLVLFVLPVFLIYLFIYLVAWHSGRTSVSDWRTFPVLRSTCS